MSLRVYTVNLVNQYERNELIATAKTITIEPNFAQRIIPLLDLTNLDEKASLDDITTLCRDADTLLGKTAAVCIYPQFVKHAKEILMGDIIKIATVANFPEGSTDLSATLVTINKAIEDGAQEIDVVMPYSAYLAGNHDIISSFTQACKEACGENNKLKVILETGALKNFEIIQAAGVAVIDAGADFIKTSTGKISEGATPEAVIAMLLAIKNANRSAGIKIAGGVRTAQQAASYLFLIEQILGRNWITADKTRIGASSLLKDLLSPAK